MRFCAILILSVISILNSLELKSQTVVNILSNGYKLERSLFLHGKKIGVCNVQKITSAEKLRSRAFDEIVPFRKFIIKDDTSALL